MRNMRYIICLSVTTVLLVHAEDGWTNFQFPNGDAGVKARSTTGSSVSFVPEDGAAPPPWFIGTQHQQQSGFIPAVQTQIRSFFDDESGEFLQPWTQVKANPIPHTPTKAKPANYQPLVTQQPTLKQAQSSVKEPTVPAVKLSAAPSSKQQADLYRPEDPVKHNRQTTRPQYEDSSEYDYEYYDEDSPFSTPQKEEESQKFFEESVEEVSKAARRPVQQDQRLKSQPPFQPFEDFYNSAGQKPATVEHQFEELQPPKSNSASKKQKPEVQKPVEDFPSVRGTTKKPQKNQLHSDLLPSDVPLSNDEQFLYDSSTKGTTKKPQKNQLHSDILPSEVPLSNGEDSLFDSYYGHEGERQPESTSAASRRKPKPSKASSNVEVAAVPSRIRIKNPSHSEEDDGPVDKKTEQYSSGQWTDNHDDQPAFEPSRRRPTNKPALSTESYSEFYSEEDVYQSANQGKHTDYQGPQLPIRQQPSSTGGKKGTSNFSEQPAYAPTVPSKRPSRPPTNKRPSVSAPEPNEPIDAASLAILKDISTIISSTKRPSALRTTVQPAESQPSQYDTSIELDHHQENPESPEPASTVRPEKAFRPIGKNRTKNKPVVLSTESGSEEPEEHHGHQGSTEGEEQMFPQTASPLDLVAPVPHVVSTETSTAPQIDEIKTTSSTLFPPFSKRNRPTTATPPTLEEKPDVKSPSSSGQMRISSYKQRIEAMKERARQKEQQAQSQTKQKGKAAEGEDVPAIEGATSTTTSSTTPKPTTTRPKVPPRMPTRKSLRSTTTTTTTSALSSADQDSLPVDQQPRRRFKPRVNVSVPTAVDTSKIQDSSSIQTEMFGDTPESTHISTEVQMDEERDADKEESVKQSVTVHKESSMRPGKTKNSRLRAGNNRAPAAKQPDSSEQEGQSHQYSDIHVMPAMSSEKATDKDEYDEETSEILDQQEFSSSSHSMEYMTDIHPEDKTLHRHTPAELRAGLLQTVPMSPDLSDPVSKARKQFFAMANHDPMLPIEELLNIRVRDNGKGM